jgi:hypothetical protein
MAEVSRGGRFEVKQHRLYGSGGGPPGGWAGQRRRARARPLGGGRAAPWQQRGEPAVAAGPCACGRTARLSSGSTLGVGPARTRRSHGGAPFDLDTLAAHSSIGQEDDAMRSIRFIVLIAAAITTARVAGAQEVRIGVGVSTTRNTIDWSAFFSGGMREVITRSQTTTVYDPADNPPTPVAGVDFDVASASPVKSTAVTRYVPLPSDPDFDTVSVDAESTTANGVVEETSFSFKLGGPQPVVVGPMNGPDTDVPGHQRVIGGKTFDFRSTSHGTAIDAILVAPTYEDLIAGREIREAREPGTRLVQGSMQVAGPSGEPVGFYAGDLRTARNESFTTPR